MRKRNLLGVGVCSTDYDEACETIRAAAVEKRSLAVTALAVHGVMTGVLDPMHRRRLNSLDVVLPDGQPVRWGLNLLYRDGVPDRVCGPRLMLRVCEMAEANGLSIGFYGNRESVLRDLRERLLSQFPRLRIAAMMPSRFGRVTPDEQAAVADRIDSCGADILFVGLGCPRQEVWLFENRERLRMPILAVGAALDFHAKHIHHAPQWMQDAGLEWTYRLWQEPRRLWRRYLFLNPLYLLMLASQKLSLRKYGAREDDQPISYEGYA